MSHRSRSMLAALGASATLLASSVALAGPVHAVPGGRSCPTTAFWVGEGWGADRGHRAHTGIDLGGRRGTPILAVEDGVIDRTKRQSNGALQIVMKGRSGAKYYYGHMDDVLVDGGQRVRAGDVIGRMGDSGSAGAVHLHFEFWRSGGESDAVDPEPLIGRICDLSADGTTGTAGTGVTSAPKPSPAATPEAGSDVAGEVFSN